jgi:hypothetical protein
MSWVEKEGANEMKAECGNKWDSRMARVLKGENRRAQLLRSWERPGMREIDLLNHEAGQIVHYWLCLDV